MLLGAVILAVLAGGALFTLYKMYPPAKLKTMAQEYVAKKFQREISFDNISFTWIGFTLNNFALSENSTFADGTFIKADKLTAHVAVKPLLKKRIEITTLEADGLHINILKQKDGTFNFDTLLPAQDAATNNTPATADTNSSTPLILLAEKIALTDCDFVYKDEQTGLRLEAKDINLEINHFDLKDPFETVISFTTDISGTGQPDMSLPVTLHVQTNLANLNLPAAYATVSEASAQYKSAVLKLQGEIKNFQTPDVKLTGTLSGINNQVLSELVPDLPNFTLPLINFTLNAAANLDENTARITEAKLAVKNSFLKTNGNLNWASVKPAYTLNTNVAVNLNEVVQMADTLSDFSPAGVIKGTFKATEKKDFTDVSGTVTLSNVSVLYPPFTLTDTNGTINILSLDNIASPALTGKLNGENFKASFSYKNIQKVLNIILNLSLDKLILKEFPSSANTTADATSPAPAPTQTQENTTRMNIQANVTVNGVKIPYVESDGFVLNANLTDVTDSMAFTNGTVDFTLQPGKMTNLDDFIKDSKIAKIILLPVGIVKKVAGLLKIDLFPQNKDDNGTTISFTQGEGNYTFTNGKMAINKTLFNSTLTNITATGTANFKTDALDMKAKATLLTQAAPLSFKITGTMSNPKGKLDVVNTVTSVVGGILNGTAVKSAANGGTNLTKGAVDTAGSAVKETVNTATDLVKGIGSLFKKKKENAD